jgi:SWIM zinc finger
VKFCASYRTYSSDLPVFLRNRPRDFVRHVCSRWQSACDFSETDITVVDDYTLIVRSPDSDKEYKVHFGKSEENLMPRCDCFDWQKYRWPCKHFCAVFRLVDKYGWSKLSYVYRDSPFITIDEDVVTSDAPLIEPANDAANEVTDTDFCIVRPSEDEQQEREVSANSCANTATKCRDALRTLNDLTFLCTDAASLRQLNNQINEILVSFRRILPQEEGLLLQPPVKKKNTKKKSVSFASDETCGHTTDFSERRLRKRNVASRNYGTAGKTSYSSTRGKLCTLVYTLICIFRDI